MDPGTINSVILSIHRGNSLPRHLHANIVIGGMNRGLENNSMLSDYSWATPPTDGVASDEDVAFLRSWLDGFRNPTSDPFDGCEPLFPVRRSAAAIIQRSVDPYGNLWGESYTVDSVRSSTHVTSESLSGNISSVTFFLRLEHASWTFITENT